MSHPPAVHSQGGAELAEFGQRLDAVGGSGGSGGLELPASCSPRQAGHTTSRSATASRAETATVMARGRRLAAKPGWARAPCSAAAAPGWSND